MKILIMCEGPNELKVINLLLDANKLVFNRDDLLDMRPFHARQLDAPQLKPALDSYQDKVVVYRIGDKLSDKLKIPKDMADRISEQRKFCTKPELEMLFIIAEQLTSQFGKVKSKQKPKEFCKQTVVFNRQHYNNSTSFYEDYFGSRIDLLINSITEYHRTHGKHNPDEGYLFDLLK